jgi:hypothetical protein
LVTCCDKHLNVVIHSLAFVAPDIKVCCVEQHNLNW